MQIHFSQNIKKILKGKRIVHTGRKITGSGGAKFPMVWCSAQFLLIKTSI